MAKWKFFYHSPARVVDYVLYIIHYTLYRIYIFNFKKTNKQTNKQKTRRHKAKEIKEVKITSAEILTRYDDIVCKFALCTFNLLIESWISSGCSYELNVVCVQREKCGICYTATTYQGSSFVPVCS